MPIRRLGEGGSPLLLSAHDGGVKAPARSIHGSIED